MKAYKSLDSYKYFINGWVANVKGVAVSGSDSHLVMCSVRHSQRLTVPPATPLFNELYLDEPFITIAFIKPIELIEMELLPDLVGKWFTKKQRLFHHICLLTFLLIIL